MTDTEAGFAMMDDDQVVAFIKANWKDQSCRYEVVCAIKAAGKDLIEKAGLSEVFDLVGGLVKCHCEPGCDFWMFGDSAPKEAR